MMPPICAFCRKRFTARAGKLLNFKINDEDMAFNKRFEQPGFVGHKKGAYWFCENHVEQAKTLTHLSINDAKSIMKGPQ